MGIDEISRILGNLERGQQDQAVMLAEVKHDVGNVKHDVARLRMEVVALVSDGCARGKDHTAKIDKQDSQIKKLFVIVNSPKRTAAIWGGGIGAFILALVEGIKALTGK
jgi:hypothetical protein